MSHMIMTVKVFAGDLHTRLGRYQHNFSPKHLAGTIAHVLTFKFISWFLVIAYYF